MYLTLIKKTKGYEKFKMEHILVEIILEDNKVKTISSNKEILVNDDIFAEVCEYIKGKEIEEREIIKLGKMFYITFTNCSKHSDDLFYVGRKLKEIMENEALNEIQDLEELVKSIEDSRGRFA